MALGGALLGGSLLVVLAVALLPGILFLVGIWRIGTGVKANASATRHLAESIAHHLAQKPAARRSTATVAQAVDELSKGEPAAVADPPATPKKAGFTTEQVVAIAVLLVIFAVVVVLYLTGVLPR